MLSFLELSDAYGLDYFLVELELREGCLLLNSPAGLYKGINKRIPVLEIADLAVSSFDLGGRLSFYHETDCYTFVDYGSGVLNYLRQLLLKN